MSEALRSRDLRVLRYVQDHPMLTEHRIGAALWGPAGRPDNKARATLFRLERLGLVSPGSGYPLSTAQWRLTEAGHNAVSPEHGGMT